MSFYPSVLHEISVLVELILGHLRYLLTDVPPQPNSPPDYVFNLDPRGRGEGRWFLRGSPRRQPAPGHPPEGGQRSAQEEARGPEAALPRLRARVCARKWGPRGPRFHLIE